MAASTKTNLADRLAVVPAADLHPQDESENPRRGDVNGIASSIRELGFVDVIVVDRDSGDIVHGNHRYLAGIAEGLTEFPVLYVDAPDRTTRRRIAVALNGWADRAGWSDPILADALVDLRDHDLLPGLPFDSDDIDALIASLEELPPDDEPEPRMPPAEVTVQIGTVKFTVTRAEWDTFEQRLVTTAGTSRDAQISELRGVLGI